MMPVVKWKIQRRRHQERAGIVRADLLKERMLDLGLEGKGGLQEGVKHDCHKDRAAAVKSGKSRADWQAERLEHMPLHDQLSNPEPFAVLHSQFLQEWEALILASANSHGVNTPSTADTKDV